LGAGKQTAPALLSAICWKLLSYMMIIGQSAGNLVFVQLGFFRDYMLKISYKISFFFTKIRTVNLINSFSNSSVLYSQENIYKSINKNFGSYLAGLVEGDGCIYIPKAEKDIHNKTISPIISIAFNAKDFPLAIILQQRLSTGQLIKVKNKNAYTLRISNYKNLALLVNIINGYMRTPKILCYASKAAN